MKSLPEEREHVGPHISNPESRGIETLPEVQVENREMFVEFCLEEDYVVSSTMFQKHQEDLITFRNTRAAAFASPLTSTRFSQIDHILKRRRWRNAIRDVNTTHNTSLESDHTLLVADVEIKLAKQTKKSTPRAPKYREPSNEQRVTYNQMIGQLIGCPPQNEDANPMNAFAQCLQKAATQSFPIISPNQRQPYLSASTWNLLESRQEACRQGQLEIAQELTQRIKKEVRKDKESHLLRQLEEIEGSSYSWAGPEASQDRPSAETHKISRQKRKTNSAQLVSPQGSRIFSRGAMEKTGSVATT